MMSKPAHILTLRLSAMGDVAMMVPVLLAMRRVYPEVRITGLSRKFFLNILNQIPDIDTVAVDANNNKMGPLDLRKLAKTLPSDVTHYADLHESLRSKILKLWLKKMRYARIDKGRADKKALTRGDNKVFKQLQTTHERYADVFRTLGFPLELQASDVLPRQDIPVLDFPFIKTQKRWIGIAPFAAHEGKVYPAVAMQEVIKLLAAQDVEVLLYGSRGPEAQVLEDWAIPYDNVTSLAGKISFADELALISNLDVMLSMDSGNGHLAAMYGVRVLNLWGVTHPYAGFVPYNQREEDQLTPDLQQYPLIPTSIYGNKFPEGYGNCMLTIEPQRVVEVLMNNE